MKLVRLTTKIFDHLAGKTWVKSKNLEMAKSVLVDGKTISEVAEMNGANKQLVAKQVNYIRREFDEEPHPEAALVNIDRPIPMVVAMELMKLIEVMGDKPGSKRALAAADSLKELTARIEALK